jgi:hypothetical protein
MAAPLVIEEERGTCTGNYHPHNGYYAGDFSGARAPSPIARHAAPPEAAGGRATRAGGSASFGLAAPSSWRG